jgi:hypothetical protein
MLLLLYRDTQHTLEHAMPYTFDANIVSDLHKDAYGFRPTASWWECWKFQDDDGKQAAWNTLLDDLEQSIPRERDEQEAAVNAYEAAIRRNMQHGATDRATAIRWMLQAMDLSENDLCYGGSYVCYELGLPYHMQTEFNDICKQMLAVFQKEAA